MSDGSSLTVRDLQLALLDIMKDFDLLCKENGIEYSLAAGTMLGAVRHKGFIPWDDDVDVFLTRGNYDKIMNLDDEVFKVKGYTLQRPFSKSWPSTYAKLCKNNTTYIENYRSKNTEQHHGIFIDLLPIDSLSENHFKQGIQWYCYRLLSAKTLYKRGYTTNSIVKKLVMLLSQLLPDKLLISACINVKDNKSQMAHCFFGGAKTKSKNIFSKELLREYKLMPFETENFPVFSEYDKILKTQYGDYMQLPPEKDRIAALHAIALDLKRQWSEEEVDAAFKRYMEQNK